MTAPIAIIMGSQSDWDTMRHAAETLTALGVGSEKHIVSAHRTPDRLFAFAKGAKAAGFKIIIAGAGGAAHLPGMAASLTELPVFGVPIESRALSGLDSLYSMVQMPAGIPVGTLAIGKAGAINAALLAASVLALNDSALAGRLVAWRKAQTDAGGERPGGAAGRLRNRGRRSRGDASEFSAAGNWAGCWRWRPRASASNARCFRRIRTRRRSMWCITPPAPNMPMSRRWNCSPTTSISSPTNSRTCRRRLR